MFQQWLSSNPSSKNQSTETFKAETNPYHQNPTQQVSDIIETMKKNPKVPYSFMGPTIKDLIPLDSRVIHGHSALRYSDLKTHRFATTKFGKLSDEKMNAMSVGDILHSSISDTSNNKDGLYDLRMGPSTRSRYCAQCSNPYIKCQFHPMKMNLPIPIVTPNDVDVATSYFNCIAPCCGILRIPITPKLYNDLMSYHYKDRRAILAKLCKPWYVSKSFRLTASRLLKRFHTLKT